MGQLFKQYIHSNSNGSGIFGCAKCHTHLASHDHIISKQFQGQTGPAYLFEKVINVQQGDLETRNMTTGLHSIRDVQCVHCQVTVGWKYEFAFNETQKYKEGKYILEVRLMVDLVEQ